MASLFDGTEGMEDIAGILGQMETNCPSPWSNSKKLWELRWATGIASHNTKPETMLEYAVAMLAENGHMLEWLNQCPTASGIGDSYRNKRRCVDLAHWREADGHVRLIELKWESNSPSKAVRQVLLYGAAYVFCRMHRDRDRDRLPVHHWVTDVRHVSL